MCQSAPAPHQEAQCVVIWPSFERIRGGAGGHIGHKSTTASPGALRYIVVGIASIQYPQPCSALPSSTPGLTY